MIMSGFKNKYWKNELITLLGEKNVLLSYAEINPYSTGIRVGKGKAEAVALPNSLLQIWQILKIAVRNNLIIIMQAANTGLTGGSTPDGENYDREILIINTLKIDKIIPLKDAKQIVALPGSALYKLEEILARKNRSPHSIIGSSCIGASIVGGVCNNSGGNLLKRGPAYTELSLFASIDNDGQLKLINNLDIELGNTPEEILVNLQSENFSAQDVTYGEKLASDKDYQIRVRDFNSPEPARFNSDKRRLYEASGCAGKIAVFAVRLDTFEKEISKKVFFLGTNNPDEFTKFREKVLLKVNHLPDMAEYMHKSFFEASENFCKDNFLIIKNLGTKFLPKLFSIKSRIDNYLRFLKFIKKNISDNLLQKLSILLPNHLPKEIIEFRNKFEHYLIIQASDESIEEIRNILIEDKEKNYDYEFLECNKKDGESLLLHRYVAGGAPKRIKIIEEENVGNIVAFDVALPRNCKNWHQIIDENVLKDMEYQFKMGHFFCMVFHWDFILKKNVNQEKVKEKMLALFKKINAKFPAEHNVGHIYNAEPVLKDHYKELDPTNSFNSGVGKTSKNKNYI